MWQGPSYDENDSCGLLSEREMQTFMNCSPNFARGRLSIVLKAATSFPAVYFGPPVT